MPTSLSTFHPAVRDWFAGAFGSPTPCQHRAWSAIASGSHTLVAAPTGSGKTLAAFLHAIDALVREGLDGELPEETRVLYVSPLKALGNDVQKNLEVPLEGIGDVLEAQGGPRPPVRTMVRTGDTPAAARTAMRKHPPHILVTTPESLYILLTSEGGRAMLTTVATVIVDEIHAVAGSKRGAHLALSLERLDALSPAPLTRIGLSATQRPIEEVARLLTGLGDDRRPRPCTIVDVGHTRDMDLAVVVPESPLEAVMSGEVWGEVYEQLCALVAAHRTTLVFVNTRRMAERLARSLSERLGDERVTSHHGSLSRERRLDAEQRLKSGALDVLVATASLELGIDIGDVDLVCQIGSTRSIATFLQRVGRSGHGVSATPKGRLFPLTRDELVECTALFDAVRRKELDLLHVPRHPLDVLAQQIVAMAACEEWDEEHLFTLLTRAHPYRDLNRERYRGVVRMLAEGFSTRRGRRSAYLHRDPVNRRLRARKGARLTALTSGGAIPDNADFDVLLEPGGTYLGSLNEDFAIESLPGDIFQLGNASWRVLRIERSAVRVADAHGLPPSIPFWFGEAPGRTDELSRCVGGTMRWLASALAADGCEAPARQRIAERLTERTGVGPEATAQLVEYLAAAHAALGALPDPDTVVLERFFDESGGMQLVIHSCFGSRVNRAWGLALRKRFCRKFNFELQAAATEDAIVLSLGETHSFALEEVSRYLSAATVRDVLVQALLDAPVFDVRWRWNANIALAVPRFQSGRKVPPQLQRMQAEDLVAVVFPDQIACLENIAGAREIPDHPLVEQTIEDALVEAMDIAGLERLLERLASGELRVVCCDLTEPSPLSAEILNARPYAFLDDAPLEERRTRAVYARRFIAPESAADIGRLDAAALDRVKSEAWPRVGDPDELQDALATLTFVTAEEGFTGLHPDQIDRASMARAAALRADDGPACGWSSFFAALCDQGRACRLRTGAGRTLWTVAERLPVLQAIFPDAVVEPPVVAPEDDRRVDWTRDRATAEVLRSRLTGLGPVTARALAEQLGAAPVDVDVALAQLEGEGFVLRGRFNPQATVIEWCERRLLARIHRYTIKKLRREIEPVTAQAYLGFLCNWHQIDDRRGGAEGLAAALDQLDGFAAPASSWESDLLPTRIDGFEPALLDRHCLAGRSIWARRITSDGGTRSPISTTPIAILGRRSAHRWLPPAAADRTEPSAPARAVLEALRASGACFFDDLTAMANLTADDAVTALGELAARGLVNSDGFAGLRALIGPARRARRALDQAGRWTLVNATDRAETALDETGLEALAQTLLRRYGVVFKTVLERETGLPPWRDLLRAFRRLEARGDIRGGRFVAGFSGEQFALAEAIPALRAARSAIGRLTVVAAADPLNLIGIITPGPRIAARADSRIAIRDGEPIAIIAGGDIEWLTSLSASEEWSVRTRLLDTRIPGQHDDAARLPS